MPLLHGITLRYQDKDFELLHTCNHDVELDVNEHTLVLDLNNYNQEDTSMISSLFLRWKFVQKTTTNQTTSTLIPSLNDLVPIDAALLDMGTTSERVYHPTW